MGKFAWVTLATNDSYSLGALVLAHSLRRVNTAHQLVVLITPGVTEAMKTQLSAVFNVVKLVDVLDSRDAENLTLLARPELGITFTKLHCWKLTEYEKCVFLDADTLVLQNSDELFEREELSAAPDAGWPDCFNSGVFVYKPSQETFQALIEFALIHGSFDGGDQGLLNLFFSDWATKDIKKHLPFVYNMCSTATYSYLPAFKQYGAGLKIIHFIGAAKPWFQPFNTETGLVSVSGESQHLVQFVQLWWDTFCAHVHPTLSTEMAGLAGALATVTLGAPMSVEQRALEEHLRRQGWEQGNIDYMGKDSFANIWQKICETLGTSAPAAQPSPPEDAPAPVAPVAAPVYVSSVEISPSGQIDKTPPQANYAPVSALKPTVEASDIKDATAAPISETATVALEPKPSVTEIAPTEASITPSATLETAKLKPQDASEPPATQQSVAPAESTEKTETAPATPSETPVTPTVVTPTPSVQTPVEAPVLPQSVPTQIESAPTPTPIESVLPLTSIEVPVLPSSAPTATDVSALTPTTAEAPASTPSAPAPTEVPVSTPIEAPALPPAAATPTESALTPAPTESQVSTPPAPAPIEVPILTPTELPASTPPAQIATETPVPSTPIPTETPIPPAPVPIDAPVPAPTETPISSTPAPVTTPVPTEAPISSPPASTPTGTPTPATPALLESPVPGSPASTPAPTPTTQVAPETTPAPPESTASVAVTEPSAPVPAATPGNLPTPTAESIAPIAKAEPATPQTPTVTEPTPPTSPPVVADTPQLTKLQVEADVPGTPPAGGSTQPSLGEAVADEPPVPPKRKGGSKAPQDSKNQKGGKPSKGKK